MYVSKLDMSDKIRELKDKNIFYRYFVSNKWLKRKIESLNRDYLFEKECQYKDLLNNINGHALDNHQRKIVLSEEDSTLVIAGAGSGKSLTILGRILYLVKSGVDPNDILCISFTNKACDNLRRKLVNNGIDMKVYTFHKLGMEILKSNGLFRNIVDSNILMNIIDDVIRENNVLDILPDYNFYDFGDGDFSFLHHRMSLETKNIYNLKILFLTFINLFKGNNFCVEKFESFIDLNNLENDSFLRKRNRRLLLLLKEVYIRYMNYLKKNKCIDFHDMINESINVVEKYGTCNYKYIIIDEYQDISLVKCELIKLIKEKAGAKLLAVGDDFQSIYRFAGSNLKVFLEFENYFPQSKIFRLEKTYRNSQELLDIMGTFILKNKHQINKRLVSNKKMDIPIYIYYYDDNLNDVLNEIIKCIGDNYLIIGRNNKDFSNIKCIDKCLTVHKSKGLEADNVIIVNLEDSVNGFPNKIVNDDILKYVSDNNDAFPYEEERRLFYVAMTRTRNCNYLLVNKKNPSIFVSELLKDNKNIKVIYDVLYCPKCGGRLVKRTGRYGDFYGCVNFPKCRYTKDIN